jgi:hypothetical protein
MVRGTPKRTVRTQDEPGALVPTLGGWPPDHFFRSRPFRDATRFAPRWRMPTPKQIKLASAAGRKPRGMPKPGRGDPMPAEYWDAILGDPRAGSGPEPPGPCLRALGLSEILQHILRLSCSRCARIVEIQKADKADRRWTIRGHHRISVGASWTGYRDLNSGGPLNPKRCADSIRSLPTSPGSARCSKSSTDIRQPAANASRLRYRANSARVAASSAPRNGFERRSRSGATPSLSA